jgi:iron complex outermembrane receptor protein
MVSLRRFLTFAALAATFGAGPAYPQPADVRISGMIRDSTGAALPGATVTISNEATGASQSVTSGADGSFAANVASGHYTIAVSLRGFTRQSRRDVEVGASGATVDFSLEAGREEEVTVTAMLREQSVADVPFSIAAPTEGDLRERGADDIEDVAANVAGFTVQNLGPGQSQVAMRGVSAGQIVRDQPGVKEQVGSYLDDSIISLSLFTPDMDLFDVARVEVLRGPQGTLFGAGSLSGTVRYISNQPELGARRYFGEVGASAISGGSVGGSAKFGFNLPMGDKAALRVAAYYNRIAGYIDAIQPDLSVNEDVNEGDRTGVRAALRLAPSDRLTITPRIVFQRVEMDGWNRVDAFNILANPYTTTRPAVTLGEREQFTQILEPFSDDFLLGDLNLRYDFGDMDFTSITSYVTRDVLVVRDAGALTSSITGGSIGLPESVYTLDSPLDDATEASVWTQELRLSGAARKLSWVVGGFYSDTRRDYAQSLLVAGFEEATGIPTQGLRAPRNVLFFSDLGYDLTQFAAFGEATYSLSDRLDLTGGLRYYSFEEDKEQIFDGIFAHDNTGTQIVSQPGTTDANGFAPRFIATYRATDDVKLNAQVSRGFRLGGINDPLNIPLCTPQDLVTFGGREAWDDETAWNYEVGAKSRVMGGRGTFNVALFNMDIRDLQATVTAGSCSSRVIFNVPKARSRGVEVEFSAAPNENFDFAISGSFNNSELRSTLTATGGIVSGIEEGTRLPTVPEVQVAAAATYQRPMASGLGYLTGTFQHIGSRFTQIGDQAAGFGVVNLNAFGDNALGGPLTASTFTFDPELPSYSLVNLRAGFARGRWDLAAYVNNVTDERALLALDQERGTLARVGFLTNQPRTFGVLIRVNN